MVMGIYDPVLQAYQHGVDQQIDLASRPMTLAQSILQGYQQGFGNRMQQEHLALQRDQLAEQMRRAQAQEAEARMWHQGQIQDKLLRQYQDDVVATPGQAAARRDALIRTGMAPEVAANFMPDPAETAESKTARYAPLKDQNWAGSVNIDGSELPAEPLKTTDQYNPDEAPKEYTPSMGGKAILKSRGLDIKEDQNAVMADLKARRNQIAEDYNNGRLKDAAAKLKAKAEMAELDRKIKQQIADAASSRAESYGRYVDKWQSANVAVTGGSGEINKQSKEYQAALKANQDRLEKRAKSPLDDMYGKSPEDILALADKLTLQGFQGGQQRLPGAPTVADNPYDETQDTERVQAANAIARANNDPKKIMQIKARYKQRTGKDY